MWEGEEGEKGEVERCCRRRKLGLDPDPNTDEGMVLPSEHAAAASDAAVKAFYRSKYKLEGSEGKEAGRKVEGRKSSWVSRNLGGL